MSRLCMTACLAFLLAGCPDNKPTFQDAGPTDAAVDAPTDAAIDAAIDAAAPLPAYELTGGAAKVRGSRFSADVQIGHGLGQEPASGNGKTIESNAAVKP